MPACLVQEYLHNSQGTHDKGYISRVFEIGPQLYRHVKEYGRRGLTFQVRHIDHKYEYMAKKAHYDIVREKQRDGYDIVQPSSLGYTILPGRGNQDSGDTAAAAAPPAAAPPRPAPVQSIWQPAELTPVVDARAAQILTDDLWFAQRKADGTRLRLTADADGVIGCYNKLGQPVLRPDETETLARALFKAIGRYDLDGEQLGPGEFVIFDDHAAREKGAFDRFAGLVRLRPLFPASVRLIEAAATTASKEALAGRARAEGWEGLVFKHREQPYLPGRNAYNLKWKFWEEVTCEIGGVVHTSQSEFGAATLTVYDEDGRGLPVGRVSSGFKAGELESVSLALARGETVYADVKFLNFTGAALYQPAFKRRREDVTAESIRVTSLKGAEGRTFRLREIEHPRPMSASETATVENLQELVAS